ncbi:hypothetical protein HPB51_019331 [Rhipicephalus microplus]|uniref:Uncharacterized protein n=1 Tax=Rhipicephalus microplus TaxID=6941 RepID=A0A9J6DC36_RHIMP|nr:hypothetical protein HPB51_019331 [Rhipicephalus microplus]
MKGVPSLARPVPALNTKSIRADLDHERKYPYDTEIMMWCGSRPDGVRKFQPQPLRWRQTEASEQTPSRRSFLFDPVAKDLISFEADDCNSTRYGPLGDPLLSFTGIDPFFRAPYDDSPLDGLSPSAAPSYWGHSGVGGNAPTDLSWSRTQRVDDVVREPARLTDNVAAFTDARWPEAHLGDAFDGRGPPCSAVDPFASRVRPQAPVGAQTLPSSMPCTGPFWSDAHVGEQARAPVTAAPASEQSPLHATAAQLLNVLLDAVHSQLCALKGDPES